MCALSRRVVVTSRCGRRIFGSQANDLPEKGGGRGIQYGVAAAIVSAGPVGGRERAGGGDGGAAVAGWAFQWLAQLGFSPDSWTAPQDQVRVGAGDDATRQAARQIIAHSARLRAAGETRIPLYVHDAGYDEAPLTWDLREHLSPVQILVRLRNDRVLYPDPPPRIPGNAGRPRNHRAAADPVECQDPAPLNAPD